MRWLLRIHAYIYIYYKSAQKCYSLMEMDVVWEPQEIVDNLKFIDHLLSHSKYASQSTSDYSKEVY